jgi:hypothetical protein
MTKKQEIFTKVRVNYLFQEIFTDMRDRSEVVDAIIDDVIEDVDCCADWSDLNDDEINLSDIDIAVARIIKNKITNE